MSAIAISGNYRNDFFRRACKYYSDQFPEWEIFLCSNYVEHELPKLQKAYPNVKGWKFLTNTGFHSGAIDVINGALDQCLGHDQVISIHCDVLIYDMASVLRSFSLLKEKDAIFTGSRLVWGNQGICTEILFIDMARARAASFFPIVNTCAPLVVSGPAQDEAESCLLKHVQKFGDHFFINLRTRPSYGTFPDLGFLHMHPPQTAEDYTALDPMGLGQYAVKNFLAPL